jgi:lipoprotein-anchoring transpeptidase ErfK/SrfK
VLSRYCDRVIAPLNRFLSSRLPANPVRRSPLIAVTVLSAIALTLSACAPPLTHGSGASASSGAGSSVISSSTAPVTGASSSSSVAARPVHIKLLEDDSNGPATYGVGMPIVAYFSAKITDGSGFAKATTVTVNGQPNAGHWYFEASNVIKGYPLEAHYRPARDPSTGSSYWLADSAVSMKMATTGVSAGAGFAFNDSLTLRMNIGDAHISTVDCAAERMTVRSNGVVAHPQMLTSCGATKTPTAVGTKVVMQLGEDLPGSNTLRPNGAVRMVGSGGAHYDLVVPWSVRVTQGGEYVHAAAWNGKNIGQRSTSDGCTNLNTPDAEWFFKFSRIGDVVNYINTGGPPMQVWDGYGDWNVPDSTWAAGGLVPTS